MYGIFEILLPLIWRVSPYKIRYKLTQLIERARERSQVQIPSNEVLVYAVSEDSMKKFETSPKFKVLPTANLPKTSLIISCKGEGETISNFLKSLTEQSLMPDELVVCCADDSIKVSKLLDDWAQKNPTTKTSKIYLKDSTISEARNEAIKKSNNDIILITDLGTSLDKDWVKLMTEPFSNPEVDAVLGYYKVVLEYPWQLALSKFMVPDVNPESIQKFLPSTRSFGIKKSVFNELGGFNEDLSFAAEDSLFGFLLKRANKNLVYSPDALVYWYFPKTIKEAWIKIHKYARGDAETGFLFWEHYIRQANVFFRAIFDFIFISLIFIFLSQFKSVLFLLYFLPIARILKYISSYGVRFSKIFDRWDEFLAVMVLITSQFTGFARGLFTLLRKPVLKELFNK